MNNNPRRILIFSLVYYPRFIGGAEVAIKEITDRIENVEFDMVTMDKTGSREERLGNVHIYRVGPRWLNKNKYFWNLYKYVFIFAAYLKAAKLHKQHAYDGTWAMMANYAGFAALFFKLRFPHVPFLLTLQEGDPIPYIKRRVALVYPLFKKIFKKADRIQTISNYLAHFARDMGFKGTPVVIPNGVDIEHFSHSLPIEEARAIRSKFGFSESDIVLVTASRLVKKNGIADVIDALPFLPKHYKFLILGTGNLRSALETRSKLLDGRVVFGGFIPHADLSRYLHACDIFIRPSISEGLGNSFLEAMMCDIPAIATNVGGIPDFLIDGETGIFCEVNNPSSVAKTVLKLEDEKLRLHIVKHAHEMVVQKYDWSGIAQAMDEQFETSNPK